MREEKYISVQHLNSKTQRRDYLRNLSWEGKTIIWMLIAAEWGQDLGVIQLPVHIIKPARCTNFSNLFLE